MAAELNLFPSYPDNARLWVFPLSDELTETREEELKGKLEEFVASWKAHGQAVHGAFRVVYRKFVLFVADSAITMVSGCSIDSLYRAAKNALDGCGLSSLDSSWVIYRDGKTIRHASREEFKNLLSEGRVGGATLVFDNSITTLKDLRDGRWELPCQNSWHAKAFRVAGAAL